MTEAVHIISDITQRKLAEDKLETSHRELEEEVKARTVELSSANTLLKREVYRHEVAEAELQKTLENLNKTKDMLVQSEKLAAIGRLMGAVAHEILNPINIISLRMQVLKAEAALPDHVKKALSVCEIQVRRITEIIQDLGRFSRSKKKEVTFLTAININKVIEHILNRCAPRLKEQEVKTETHYSPHLPAIPLDADKMEQALFNIISHSIDAMVEQKNKVFNITTRPGTSKKSVHIVISDSGKGFPGKGSNRIFDPFYTTMAHDEGVGLGLFVAYSLIKELDGEIYVQNNQSGGASFIIELPVTPKNISQ